MQAIDRIGQKFGRLTVISISRHKGITRCHCKCECGQLKTILFTNLISHHTKSCGCIYRESRGMQAKTHGRSGTPEYESWKAMKRRCLKRWAREFRYYGGRGIKICDRWLKFENFFSDMGTRPNGHSLGRINNNGDYEPKNCRWETPSQQSSNTRRNRLLSLNGCTKPSAEWARSLSISKQALHIRLKAGWPLELALTKPKTNSPTSASACP